MQLVIVLAILLGLASVTLAGISLRGYLRNTVEELWRAYETAKWAFVASLLTFVCLATARVLGPYGVFIAIDTFLLICWLIAARAIRSRRGVLRRQTSADIGKVLLGG